MPDLTIEPDEAQQLRHAARLWGDRFRLYREQWMAVLHDRELVNALVVAYAEAFHRPPAPVVTLQQQMDGLKHVMNDVIHGDHDERES